MRLFSYRKRPVHLGPYPLERLQRQRSLPDLAAIAPMTALSFDDANPESLSHAMARYIAMFDLVRDGAVNATPGDVPAETLERTRHLKAAGYYFDASMMGCCTLPALAFGDANAESLSHAMARYSAMFDLVRDGAVNATPGDVPADPLERTRHLKAAGYYFDSSMMGCCTLPALAVLDTPIRNPQVAALGAELEASHPKSFAAGTDMILADVLV